MELNIKVTGKHRLTGHRSGLLVAERPWAFLNGTTWLCSCDCGKYVLAKEKQLINRSLDSCGCMLSDRLRKRNVNPNKLTGQVFFCLIALEQVDEIENIWRCKCCCGEGLFLARANQLIDGKITSCGCQKPYWPFEFKKMFETGRSPLSKQKYIINKEKVKNITHET